MESPNSDSSVESQFRKGFLGLLETLRFSVVLLHNELGKQAPAVEKAKPAENSTEVPAAKITWDNFEDEKTLAVPEPAADEAPKQEEKSPAVFELLEGKNSFITRIENLKHNVAYQPEIHLKEMTVMIQEFDNLKKDMVEVLQSKIASQHKNPFFSAANVLKKSIDQINQNWIKLDDKAKTLQIHTATIPEEVRANQLSSGTHTRAAKRF